MDYIDTLIDWNNDEDILKALNENIYSIAEDPCISPYQCWQILNCVNTAMKTKTYFSAIKYIAGKIDNAKTDISRSEGYRFICDLYNESIIRQSDPEMLEDDYRGYDGDIEITVSMGDKEESFDSIELFVSYMMSSDNWFKPEKFLIRWKEAGMISPVLFDSTDIDRW